MYYWEYDIRMDSFMFYSFYLSSLSRAFVAGTDLTVDDNFTFLIRNSPHADP